MFESRPILIIAQVHAGTIGYLVTAAACLIFSYSSFTNHSLRHQQGIFPFLHIAHTGSGAHPASYSMGTRVLSCWQCGRGVMFITHLHLVLSLRISGTITLVILYVLWCGH